MSRLNATLARIKDPSASELERIILETLIADGQGRGNAISGESLVSKCAVRGIATTKNQIQNRVVVPSRSTDYFIGSSHEGFFIMLTDADYAVMEDFYKKRIAAEQDHLKRVGVLREGGSLLPAPPCPQPITLREDTHIVKFV